MAAILAAVFPEGYLACSIVWFPSNSKNLSNSDRQDRFNVTTVVGFMCCLCPQWSVLLRIFSTSLLGEIGGDRKVPFGLAMLIHAWLLLKWEATEFKYILGCIIRPCLDRQTDKFLCLGRAKLKQSFNWFSSKNSVEVPGWFFFPLTEAQKRLRGS